MDRLGFWGRSYPPQLLSNLQISVSADGSTWFLGGAIRLHTVTVAVGFQYPLMDRLGFWG